MKIAANRPNDRELPHIRIQNELSIKSNENLWPAFYSCNYMRLQSSFYPLVVDVLHAHHDTLHHEGVGDEGGSRGDNKATKCIEYPGTFSANSDYR